MPGQPRPTNHLHFIVIFLLVSVNLRLAFSAADPLLVPLMQDLGLSISSSGLFGLLPVMALGIAAPLGARLVAWVRPGHLIIYAMLAAVAGVIWRSYGGIPGLFGGTVVIGLGLGIAGSIILGVVKQVEKKNLPTLMSAYTACVSLGTAIGTGASTPVAHWLGGWQHGLLFWGLPLLLAAMLWGGLMLHKRHLHTQQRTLKAPILPLLRKRAAIMVTLYYLFRVASAWLLIVWLTTLLRHRGMHPDEAGYVPGLATICQIPFALAAGVLTRRLGSMGRLMAIATLAAIAACWGLLTAPLSLWVLFAILLGFGMGSIFAIGMTLIATTEPDEAGTIALSGLAQGVGFIGGGMLAWAAGLSLRLPMPDLWLASLYTLLALCGLYFGLQCTKKPRLPD